VTVPSSEHGISPRRPIARRLRLTLFAVGALCIAVATGVFYTLWVQQTLGTRTVELERQVSVVASGVAVGGTLPGSTDDVGLARARLLKVEAGLIGARLAVTDSSGTVLFSTAGTAAARSYPVADLARSGTEFDARSGVLDVVDVGRVVVVAVPVSFAAPDTPERYLVGAKPVSEIQSGDTWVLTSIAVSVAVALLVAWGFGWWLARRFTGPIVRLTEGARAVAAGEWGKQVPTAGDDEVASLAGAFNDMSSRVADAYRSQQEFVGDVSHELRTPITSIRGFAQAIGDGTVAGPAAVRRAAGVIVGEADRLSDLTTTLLSLADLESGTVRLTTQAVEPGALADTLRARFEARAADAGLGLEIHLGDPRPLADPDRLLQAVSTLVDNALRHARGRVRVSAQATGGVWRLSVEDDGSGVPLGDRERVFGRFTRLDGSRSAESGGSGLGLAICRRIVELMGGRVSAGDSVELGGALFAIELPHA
jgi:signal transduction histidine kinase